MDRDEGLLLCIITFKHHQDLVVALNTPNRFRAEGATMKNLYSRSNETSNRPKESSALYEVARNDSNKYANLIHNGTQGLSEKREEMRLISSEAEILGNANYTENTILQLFIKPVAGHTYTPHDSITTIKSKIFDHDGIPSPLQRLVSSSKPLNEE